MPKILDKAVKAIREKGGAVNPYAAATSSLQKAGDLKQGTSQATKQGVERGQMTRAQRHKNPV